MVELVKQMFKDIIENPNYDEYKINTYFSKEYVQIVNNKELDFLNFNQHIKKMKEKIFEVEVNILNIAENENSVFTKHIAKSILKDKTTVVHKVVAEFTFENEKIIKCDEVTILLEGSEKEKNLGSEI